VTKQERNSVVFYKKKKRRKGEGGGRLTGYNLNITDKKLATIIFHL
jgi:hypothetical protein